MSNDPTPEPPEPGQRILQPDNVWSSRRLRHQRGKAKRAARKAREEFPTGKPRRGGLLTLLLVGLCIVVLAAVLTALVSQFMQQPEKAPVAVLGTDPAEKWQGGVPSEARDGFLNATSPEERLRWVRSPELVAPLIAAFYATGPGSREKINLTAALPLAELDPGQPAHEIARYGVLMEDTSKRLLSIVSTPRGAKVDFHTYSRHSTSPWPDILEGRATSAEVRLFIGPGKRHVAPFESDTAWLPVAGLSPDVPADLLLYARRDTPEALALLALLQAPPTTNPLRVTLTIAPVEESWRQRLFQITAFHAREWLGRQP